MMRGTDHGGETTGTSSPADPQVSSIAPTDPVIVSAVQATFNADFAAAPAWKVTS